MNACPGVSLVAATYRKPQGKTVVEGCVKMVSENFLMKETPVSGVRHCVCVYMCACMCSEHMGMSASVNEGQKRMSEPGGGVFICGCEPSNVGVWN